MLYDQGQVANVYLDTFSITRDTFYASITRDVLDYLRREMIGDAGEIYSAEDADSAEHHGASRKKEGAFYVWTSQEVCLFSQINWQLIYDRKPSHVTCKCYYSLNSCLASKISFLS